MFLGLQNPFVAVTGYDRKNLCFAVEKPKDKIQALLDYLDKNREKAVLFIAIPGKMWKKSTVV